MTYWHRITGDGESDDGVGCFGMECTMIGGTLASAVGEYLESPHYDVDPLTLPVYRSDQIQLNVADTPYPSAASVAGPVATFTANILPFRVAGTAIVDSAGEVFTVVSYDGYDVTMDRSGFATGAITDFYLRTPRVVTYAANTDGLPNHEKMYQQLWLNFQMLRGGETLTLGTRRFGQSTADTTTQTRDYATELGTLILEGVEFIARFDVPTAQTRAVGLQVSATIGDPISYFQLGAMAFEYEPTGTRTSRGV